MAYVSAAGQRPEDALEEEGTQTAEPTDTADANPSSPEPSEPAQSPEATTPEQSDEDVEDDDEEDNRKRFVKKYD